jgi:lipid-A-disaccharide synthase
MKIFFSVGEPSGDLHGANLINQLRERAPDTEFVGYGGPRMQAAGCELHEDLTRLAVMWLLRVIWNFRTFWNLIGEADAYFDEHRPDAVVLIDYPGFNWWIARRAKQRGIPVFYYGVPQLWAWAGWRVKKMRRFVDHVLVKLPFEVDWYEQHGCQNVHYVGHPYFDETASRTIDQSFVDSMTDSAQPLITILPGSRTQEVLKNLPWFLKSARAIHTARPDTRFAIASYNQKQADMARQAVAEQALPIEVHVDRTPELIEAAHSCLACSGSVSLELLAHAKPTVILYWIDWFAYIVQGFFIQVRYITLVNLLGVKQPLLKRTEVYDPDRADAEPVPFPEYLTKADKSAEMAAHIVHWLDDDTAYRERVAWLTDLQQQYAKPGASSRAADYMLEQLATVPAKARHAA